MKKELLANGAAATLNHVTLPFRDRPADTLVVKRDSVIGLNDVQSVSPSYGPQGWEISVNFSPAGAQKMEVFTTAHIGKQLAIVLNSIVLSAPRVNGAFSQSCMITGDFTQKEVQLLAEVFQNPAPTKFELVPAATPAP